MKSKSGRSAIISWATLLAHELFPSISQHSAGLEANVEEEDATEGKTTTLQLSLLRLKTPQTVSLSHLNRVSRTFSRCFNALVTEKPQRSRP